MSVSPWAERLNERYFGDAVHPYAAFEDVVRLAVSRPMPAVGEASNSPPYHALSYAPIAVLANAYQCWRARNGGYAGRVKGRRGSP